MNEKEIKKTLKWFKILIYAVIVTIALLVVAGIMGASSGKDKKIIGDVRYLIAVEDLKVMMDVEKVKEEDKIWTFKCLAGDSYTSNKYGSTFYIYYNENTDKIIEVTQALK